MDAVGSEKLRPILVLAMASPQSLQKSVDHLRVAQQHRDGPGAHRDGAHRGRRRGLDEGLALLEEARQAGRAVGVGHLQLREIGLVLEHVAFDRRHDVVRVLDLAAEGLGLLREVVVGQHDVGLVALVVVHHGADGLDRVRAVLLDGLPVQRPGERRDDRVDGHAVGEGALVGGDHAVPVGQRGLALLRVPEAIDLHVARRQLRLVLHELGDRVADAARVRAPQAFDDLLHPRPRNCERHLVVLGLSEDAVARARKDDLGLARLHRRDDDVGADGAPLEGGVQAPAALPQRRLRQAHHLGRTGVDADQVGLECRAVERSDQERLVFARGELVDGCLGALARFLGFRVHALAERADVVDRQRLVEADGGDAERADVVLARERDHPPVPARHVDHLARHAELLEVSRGTLRPLGDGLAGPEHADRHGEGLRADIGGELLVRRLDVDHFWKPPVRSLGAVSTFVKQPCVFSVKCGAFAMARYRIVHWKEIPSVVEAADGDRTEREQLSQKFQDLIDALAMRENATAEDAYLEGWGQGEWLERPGSAAEVARAVAAELEQGFQALLVERFMPKPG